MPSAASTVRFIRRHIHKNAFEVFISCLPGLENDTASELVQMLPRQTPRLVPGGVELKATLAEIYRLNLSLSTANRVLLRLAEFTAWSFPMLLDHASRVEWAAFVPDPEAVSLRVASTGSRLNMKDRVRQVVMDAIEKSFSGFEGLRPGATTTIQVRLHHDRVWISLDTTGEHLHFRGDKPYTDVAPIRSTLAAVAIHRSIDGATTAICDPFCGSGTVVLEAMRLASGTPPGGGRDFSFMYHPYFKEGTWRQVQRDDAAARQPQPRLAVYGGDTRKKAIEATYANIQVRARGSAAQASIRVADFADTIKDAVSRHAVGVVVTNPPYGVRVGDAKAANELQERLRGELERLPPRWKFAVFTPMPELFAASRRLAIERSDRISTGGLTVDLVQGRAVTADENA